MLEGIKKGSHIAELMFFLVVIPAIALARDYALAIYAGRLTTEKWERATLPGADFSDATMVVAAGSWTIARFFGDKLSCELEAQVG